MSILSDEPRVPRQSSDGFAYAGRVVACAAAAVSVTALTALLGWIFNIYLFKSWSPDFPAMKANTAICLLLSALALWLSRTPTSRRRHFPLLCFLILIVGATGFLIIAENTFHWNAGIDELFFRDVQSPDTGYPAGRFAPSTAVCFIFVSGSLLVIDRFRRTSQALALASLLLSLVALIGYVHQLPTLHGAGRYTAMALNTVFGFAMLALGILSARPENGLAGLLIKSWSQRSNVHKLLAGAVLLPLALGSIVIWGQRHSFYSSDLTLAIFTLLLIAMSVGLVWWTGAEKLSLEANRLHVQQALHDSEERFRTMADNIPNLAWMAAADGHIFWYNRRWYEYTGATPEQMEGAGWQSVHDPDLLPSVWERWKAALATGSRLEMVFPLRGCDGSFKPFLTRVEPVRNSRGEVTRWFGTNTDISAERAAQSQLVYASRRLMTLNAELESNNQILKKNDEQLRESLLDKGVLLKEVHHRVKNNLQVVSSLLAMQLSRSNDCEVAATLRDSQARVQSMALIHELLYQNDQFRSVDFSEYVHHLVSILQGSYRRNAEVACIMNLERTELTLEIAIPCALILNELLTNALKYAYPVGKGDILVDLHSDSTGWTEMTVRDFGVGLPAGFDAGNADSFGLTIIRALTEQVDGQFTVHTEPPGVAFTIRFPSENAALRSAAHV